MCARGLEQKTSDGSRLILSTQVSVSSHLKTNEQTNTEEKQGLLCSKDDNAKDSDYFDIIKDVK